MSNTHVQRALEILGAGLDGYLTARLKPVLGNLDWTSVLRELDLMRGREGWTYSRRDVALQLRMLTERLGALGYPFDEGDRGRTLSAYGSVLRIVRRRWAHNDEFGTFDALTAVDTVRTVLAHIGDDEHAAQAAELRAELVAELIADEAPAATADEPEPSDATDPPIQPGNASRLRGEVDWESWAVVVVGEKADLDSLRSIRSREMVRSLIEDVAEAEGPIHKSRLAKLVGYGFGFARLSEAREKKILHQLGNAAVFVDAHGFVWAEGIDVDRWLIHRTSAGVPRPFTEIAPVEVANAAASLAESRGLGLGSVELRQLLLQHFGRRNRSKAADHQLDLGLACAIIRAHIHSLAHA